MKTTINNDLRVFQVVTSTSSQFFCNIEDLNNVINENNLHAGYYTIYHFWNNKQTKLTKKELKEIFIANNIKQEFCY